MATDNATAAAAAADDAKTYTYKDVAAHASKSDIYIVVHDEVYDATSFVDEHPGGEEVLTDLGGQDATEAFEDVGHSDEAREILQGLHIGKLKRMPGDPEPKLTAASRSSGGGGGGSAAGGGAAGLGVGLYAAVVVGAAAAYGAWSWMQVQQQGGKSS